MEAPRAVRDSAAAALPAAPGRGRKARRRAPVGDLPLGPPGGVRRHQPAPRWPRRALPLRSPPLRLSCPDWPPPPPCPGRSGGRKEGKGGRGRPRRLPCSHGARLHVCAPGGAERREGPSPRGRPASSALRRAAGCSGCPGRDCSASAGEGDQLVPLEGKVAFWRGCAQRNGRALPLGNNGEASRRAGDQGSQEGQLTCRGSTKINTCSKNLQRQHRMDFSSRSLGRNRPLGLG